MSNDEKRGSGVTYTHIVHELRVQAIKAYRAELDGLSKSLGGARRGGAIKQKQIEDMACGFLDGMTHMLRHLQAMGVVEVVETPRVEAASDEPKETP